MPDIDELTIQINAESKKADKAIDNLILRLDKLTASLASVDGSRLNGLASGVSQLGTAMQTMNVKTTDFTRLAKNLKTLNEIDTSNLKSLSVNMAGIGQSLGGLSSASDGVKQISDLANGIKQLGYKSAGAAIQNIPQLAVAMKQLMQELSKAPAVSQNLIDMTNALAKLARTGSSSGRAATSLTQALNGFSHASKKAKAHSFSLASAIGKVYATYWLLFRAIGKVKESIDISSQLTEVQNVVDVTFGEYSSLVDKMAETSIVDFGMSELTVKQISSRFQAMGTAIGFSQGKMADMSIELTKLTADMASFYDVEQDAVAKSLQSIFTGETEPLRKYGLDLTNATLQEYANKKGIDAKVKSMTQAEKTLLRYQYVMDNTGAAQGDFARTANTWANQVRILKQNFESLATVVGGTFINALKPLVSALNTAMSYVIAFAETVSSALGKIFGWKYESGGGVTNDLETGVGAADDIASGMSDAADSAKKLKDYTLGIDELNVINPDSGTGSGGSSGGLDDSGVSASGNSGQWVKETEMLDYESALSSLYALGVHVGVEIQKALDSIPWDSVYEKARNFGTGLADFLNGLISPELFGEVGQTIAGALNTAVYAALSFGTAFDFENFGLSIATGINQFFADLDPASAAESINAWVQGVWETVTTAINGIEWEQVWDTAKTFLENIDIKTIAIILGTVTIKKILGLNLGGAALSVLGTTLSKKIAQSIASNLGVEIPANAGIRTALSTGLKKAFEGVSGKGLLDLGSVMDTGSLSTQLAFLSKMFVGISGVIGGASGFVKSFFEMWENGFNWFSEASLVFSVALGAIGAVILGAPALVAGVVAGIIAVVSTIAIVVHDNWDSICEWLSRIPEWFDTNLLQPIQEGFDWVTNIVSELFLSAWEKIQEEWAEVSEWFVTSVATPVAESFANMKTKVSQLFSTLWNTIKTVWNVVSGWFNNIVVTPITTLFTNFKTNAENLFTMLWDGIKTVWSTVSAWFTDTVITPVQTAFETATTTIGNVFTNLWNGIKTGVLSAMNAVVTVIEKAINGIIDMLNTLHWEIPDWVPGIGGESFGFDISHISLPKIEIPKYEIGGFPEDGLFMANHTELVGQFSNGKTAVANNEQIVAGIQQGVYEANSEQNSLIREMIGLLQDIRAKDTTIKMSGRDVGKSMDSSSRRQGYKFRTSY